MRYKIILPFLLAISFTSLASDDKWGEINEWDGVGFSQAYVSHKDGNTKSFQAVIDDDPDGKQIVEFRFVDTKNEKCISSIMDTLSDVVIKVEGTRVKMKAGCKRVAISKILRYFATTQEGRDFVVNQFKNKQAVSIELQGYIVSIPAVGFSSAWDNYGGDTI